MVVVPSLVQWIKDLALLQLKHRLQLGLQFSPWPWNLRRLCIKRKKKKEEEEEEERKRKETDLILDGVCVHMCVCAYSVWYKMNSKYYLAE